MRTERFIVELFGVKENCWLLYSNPVNESNAKNHFEILKKRGCAARIIHDGQIIDYCEAEDSKIETIPERKEVTSGRTYSKTRSRRKRV